MPPLPLLPKTPLPTFQSLSLLLCKSRDTESSHCHRIRDRHSRGRERASELGANPVRRDAREAAEEHADAPDDQRGVAAVGGEAGAPGERRRQRARGAVLFCVRRRGRDGWRGFSREGRRRLRRCRDGGVPEGVRLLRQRPRPRQGHLHIQGRGGILQPRVQGAADRAGRADGAELLPHIHQGGGPVGGRRLRPVRQRGRGRRRRRLVGKCNAQGVHARRRVFAP